MTNKYHGIDYHLLPSNLEIGDEPRKLHDLLRCAPLLFTDAEEDHLVPAAGDLIEYVDNKKKNDTFDITIGNVHSELYRVIVRQFYLRPSQDKKRIKIGIKKIE